MPPDEVDSTLFPSAEDATEAQSVWDQGVAEAARDNPVGTFQAKINEAILGRSMSSDRLQIHYELEIESGEFAGVKVHKYDGLETSQQAKITQSQLNRLGVETTGMKMEEIPAVLLDLTGKSLIFSAKQNGRYYNIYFQRLMQAGDESTPAGFGAAAKEDGDAGSPAI